MRRSGRIGNWTPRVGELLRHDRDGWRALLRAVDLDTRPLPADLEGLLAFVVDLMPDPIRVPREIREQARLRRHHDRRVRGRGSDPRALEQRDRQIRQQARTAPVQHLAREYGLSVSQVYRVLQAERAGRIQ